MLVSKYTVRLCSQGKGRTREDCPFDESHLIFTFSKEGKDKGRLSLGVKNYRMCKRESTGEIFC